MRFSPVLLRVLAAGFVAFGLQSALAAPASATPTDDAFIAALNDRGLDYGTEASAISYAKTLCGIVGPGMSNIDEAAKYLHSRTNYSQDQMVAFGRLAITAYCPQKG